MRTRMQPNLITLVSKEGTHFYKFKKVRNKTITNLCCQDDSSRSHYVLRRSGFLLEHFAELGEVQNAENSKDEVQHSQKVPMIRRHRYHTNLFHSTHFHRMKSPPN